MWRTLREGAALALTTFTIVPARRRATPVAAPDRRVAGVAMTLAPLVGVLLGAAIGGLALALRAAHAPALLIGGACVAATALLTRGLHLDGLADTADALGSYRDRDRALAIMKSPEIGPFGVVAIVLTLLIQAAAIAGLATRPWWQLMCALAAAYATGRVAAARACAPGIPAARPGGLGALFAGTVRPALGLAAALVVVALGGVSEPATAVWGVVAVAVGLLVATFLTAHCVRRLGGITGDVLGALIEVATTVAIAGLCLS